jgi:hypothetical protein
MVQITVKRLADQIALEFQLPDGQIVTVELPAEDAQQVGLALIGKASPQASGRSLLEESPLLATWNPPMEISRSETGQIILAYQAADLRPFLIQIEKERATRSARRA